tara:strand:- start:42 stop:524 length:483 start_codon:yes stop_codon:yes gene_type:complete
MKELIILRHAKSNRHYSVEDINRPLSVEGIERIKKVSNNKDIFFSDVDVIISSPANRALHTAMIMMNELDLPLEKLIIDRNLYTFSGFNVINFVYALGNHWNKVVIVGHNPAFIELINHFSNTCIDHLRTSGLAKISFEKDQWIDINKGQIIFGQKINYH